MADAITKGVRVGPFILLHDEEGLRHAVRHSAILCLSDTDEAHATTTIHLTGNRVAVVRRGLDEVLSWFA